MSSSFWCGVAGVLFIGGILVAAIGLIAGYHEIVGYGALAVAFSVPLGVAAA